MPLGHIATSPLPDALGRTHHDAQVSSPDTSPQLSSGPSFEPNQQPLERPTRKTSLIIKPNSLVSKHISTFSSADPGSPISPPTNAARPLLLSSISTSRNGDKGPSRNFTAPLPSPRSPGPPASAPSSAISATSDPSATTTTAIGSAPATPAAIKRSVSSASASANRPSPRNGRFDLYRPAAGPDKIGILTNGRQMSGRGPGTPVNRSPSSMNLPQDVSKRRIPSPLPLSASSAGGYQSADATSNLATPSPSMSSFGLETSETSEVVDIPTVIAAAGSSEAAISKLLLEKQAASSHNSQLWRLVEKQRAMILGLNKDLERALKDKEKYRRKLKDHLVSSATLTSLQGDDSRLNLADIDEGESVEGLGSSRISSRHIAGPSPLSASPSTSLSMPMHSTPMRAPFATPKSTDSSSTVKTSKSVDPRPSVDSLPSDYSIFKEQKALSSRRSPPAPLDLSPRLSDVPPASSSEYASEASVYTPQDRGRASTRQSSRPQDLRTDVQLPADRARTRSPQQANTVGPSEVQRTMSLGSGTASPDAGSPHIAQVQTYTSLNAVNAVLLDQNSVQRPATNESSLSFKPSDYKFESTSDIPLPLKISSSNPTTPSVTLFPRSPQGPPQSRHPPISSSPTATSSPQLPQPSWNIARSRSPQISERIVSAPNVIERLGASQAGIVRSSDGIYRGYMSEHYPGMLLPPSALPHVYIKVDAARLRPSRAAPPGKYSEEHAVVTLVVCSRPDDIPLWKVEKTVASLLYLDQQLRSLGTKLRFKMPDRNTFSGHAPARIDARRAALTTYLGQFLDIALHDSALNVLAEFLSADAVGIDGGKTGLYAQPTSGSASPDRPQLKKVGYLTKKGKNFGGWKTRYFILDGTTLSYYESPGGTQLGMIRLQSARIGRQTLPTEMSEEEIENQYRHAFMILEPKRQDSNSHSRHILCAETDEERDAWVFTLQYSDLKQGEDKENLSTPAMAPEESEINNESSSRSTVPSPAVNPPKRAPRLQKSMGDVHRGSTGGVRGSETLQSKSSSALRAVGYSDVVAAEAPIIGPSLSNANEPLPNQFVPGPTADTETDSVPSTHPSISGPSNATVIHDSESWTTKPTKEPKGDRKRSIFAFRTKSSTDTQAAAATGSSPAANGPEKLRIVFGAPLTAACELASPKDVKVYLPAVMYRSIEFLHANNALQEEGIFRMSGSSMAIKALRERFDNEGDVNLLAPSEDFHDVHTVASLLKLYFRELPANILTRDIHGDFLKAADLDTELRIKALNVLVNRLPRANREVLGKLSCFLKEIVDNEAINKMSVRNVGIVFAPTLNIPAPLISLFVTDYPVIFGPPLHVDLSFMAAPPTPAGTLSIFPPEAGGSPVTARPRATGPLSSFSNMSFPNLGAGSANATVASWEQQAKAAKQAFDTGYSRLDNTNSSGSTTTLTSARHALHTSRSSGSIRAGLDRSKTDSPLSSRLHRLSSAEHDSSGILNVSISQSPLLGAVDLKRDKGVEAGGGAEPSSSAGAKARRKSGQFLMNVGILDGGSNVSAGSSHRALRSWSSRSSMKYSE